MISKVFSNHSDCLIPEGFFSGEEAAVRCGGAWKGTGGMEQRSLVGLRGKGGEGGCWSFPFPEAPRFGKKNGSIGKRVTMGKSPLLRSVCPQCLSLPGSSSAEGDELGRGSVNPLFWGTEFPAVPPGTPAGKTCWMHFSRSALADVLVFWLFYWGLGGKEG